MIIETLFHWVLGSPSHAVLEREARRQQLDAALQRFDETHDKACEAKAAVKESAANASATIARACAVTRSCAAQSSGAMQAVPGKSQEK